MRGDEVQQDKFPNGKRVANYAGGALPAIGGVVPIAGGVFTADAGARPEAEKERVNPFFEYWVRILEDELKEKEETIIGIMTRLDLQDVAIAQRVESREYQSLLKKTFQEWAGAESGEKRVYIRNILSNAAACFLSSDDVVRLYIDWIRQYSEMHFHVIGAIYKSGGITRGEIWRKIGKARAREHSVDADLYKLLFRDLIVGGIIRQYRDVDRFGNCLPKSTRLRPEGNGPKQYISAFDENEGYALTDLGEKFVQYAMSDLPPRIEFGSEYEFS